MLQVKNMFLVLLLLGVTVATQADQTIRVVTDNWSLYTNKDGTGYYFDILREIFEPRGYVLEIKFLPYVRAIAMLSAGEADVALGVYQGKVDKNWYGKKPVEFDKVDVAMMPSLYKDWQGESSLKGKRVASKFGYEFNDFFDIEADYQEVRNEEALVKMLVSGRVDAVLEYERNMKTILKAMQMQDKVVIIDGVFNPPIYFVFYNSYYAKSLKKLFDEEMLTLRGSGRLKELMINNLGNDIRYAE